MNELWVLLAFCIANLGLFIALKSLHANQIKTIGPLYEPEHLRLVYQVQNLIIGLNAVVTLIVIILMVSQSVWSPWLLMAYVTINLVVAGFLVLAYDLRREAPYQLQAKVSGVGETNLFFIQIFTLVFNFGAFIVTILILVPTLV